MTYWPLNLVLHHLPYQHPFHHTDPTTQIRAFLPHDLTKTQSCPWDQGPRQQRESLSHHKVPLQWVLITPLWTTLTTWHCSSPQIHCIHTGMRLPVGIRMDESKLLWRNTVICYEKTFSFKLRSPRTNATRRA